MNMSPFKYLFIFFSVHDILTGKNEPRQKYARTDKMTNIAADHVNSGSSVYYSMERRRSHVKMTCQYYTGTHPKQREYFLLYMPKQIAYCEVPKVACTFWKRIIVFLNQDYSPKISSPMEIPRSFAHFGRRKNTKELFLNGDAKQLSELKNIEKLIMFTRDPFSRIWSAYLDKIVLPDFWLQIGVPAVKTQRRNASTHSLQCGDDATFEELIRYVLPRAKLYQSDNHFAPIHSVCNPCLLNFTYIGKIETFKDDVKHILEDNGLNYLLDLNLLNETNTVEKEIESLTEDNLGISKLDKEPQCKNFTLICERLWKVFQMNGYLGFEIPFPADTLRTVRSLKDIKRTFISHALSEYANGHAFHERWKRQRRQSLSKAYKALPKDLLQEFQSVYKNDFELFAYSKAPSDIFT